MRLIVVLLFCALYALPAVAQEWRDDDLGSRVREGVANSRSIWLFGGSGKVVRFDRVTGARQVVAENVIDMMIDGNHFWIVAKTPEEYRLQLRDLARTEQPSRRIDVEGKPLGLFRTERGLGLLTTTAVMTEDEEGWRRQMLPATLGEGGSISATGDGDVFYGLNMGEWGGGTSCVVVASGLAHLGLRHGAVFRVCGSTISPIFSAPMPPAKLSFPIKGQTWPLYSLIQVSNGWVAISDDRYFRSSGDIVEEHALPRLHDWSGLRISEPEDGVIFVLEACCWGLASNPTKFSSIAIPVVED